MFDFPKSGVTILQDLSKNRRKNHEVFDLITEENIEVQSFFDQGDVAALWMNMFVAILPLIIWCVHDGLR